MAKIDDLSFLHRKDCPLKNSQGTRDYLIGLIDQLLEVEASSHPSVDPCPYKDDLSREAIQLVGRLLECSIPSRTRRNRCGSRHRRSDVCCYAPTSSPEMNEFLSED